MGINKEIQEKLRSLDTNTCTIDDVLLASGTISEGASMNCFECGIDMDGGVAGLGEEEYSVDTDRIFCLSCLQRAISLFPSN